MSEIQNKKDNQSQDVNELIGALEELSDGLLYVGACLPLREKELRSYTSSLREVTNKYIYLLPSINILSSEVKENIENVLKQASTYVDAAKTPEIIQLLEEYDDLIENSPESSDTSASDKHMMQVQSKLDYIFDQFCINMKIPNSKQ